MSEKDNVKIHKMGIKSLFSAGGAVMILFILVLINLIFSQVNFRWDATEDNLYSLSDGTKKILSDLKNDVTIKVFYTKDNVNTPIYMKNYAKRLLDFLSEYEYYSDGKIKIEIYNPQPDSEEEDWARRYGLDPIALPSGEKVYFGLAAMSLDQEEVIPTFDPTREEQLEYDITRIIARVQSAKKPKIGVISALPIFGQAPMFNMQQPNQGAEPWAFITELKKTYDVEEISMTSESIENNIDLLLMIHPKDISDKLQYAVDQYVLNGGNLIAFVDPFAISDASQSQVKASSLDKLFKAWGVSMDAGKIVTDFELTTKLRNQSNQIEDNPLWLSVKGDFFNADDLTTAKLENMLLPVAGAIKKIPESQFEYESLLKSSKNSSLTESFRMRFGSEMLRRDFRPSNESYDLAVKIRGTFKTAFPEGKPKDKDSKDKIEDSKKEESKTEHLTEGKKKSTIIIVGDADCLFDSYYVSKQNFLGFNIARIFNDNLNFLLNTSEMLTGSEALIGIRSRGKFERTFTVVEDLEKKAQARWLEREQELVRKAEDTNRKLREFEQKKDASQQFIMTEEQEKEIQKFQDEKQRTNQELKVVRRNLRADIESLGTKVKFMNIFLMPMLVAIVGISYGIYRRKKSLVN